MPSSHPAMKTKGNSKPFDACRVKPDRNGLAKGGEVAAEGQSEGAQKLDRAPAAWIERSVGIECRDGVGQRDVAIAIDFAVQTEEQVGDVRSRRQRIVAGALAGNRDTPERLLDGIGLGRKPGQHRDVVECQIPLVAIGGASSTR